MPSVAGVLHESGGKTFGDESGLGELLGEKLVPGQEDLTCGASAIMVLEMGRVTVRCTLDKHKGSLHYDSVFLREWEDGM